MERAQRDGVMTSNNDQPQESAAKPGTEATSVASSASISRGRLTRLRINRFRQVKPGTELRFDDGINVLLGRNGTGKTTLLELICALVSGDLRAYEAEDLDLEFDMILDGEHLSVSVQSNSGPKEPFSLLAGNEIRRNWRYSTTLARQDGRVQVVKATNHITTVHEETESTPQATYPEEPLFAPFLISRSLRLLAPVHGDGSLARVIVLQGLIANACIRLDEGLDVFRSVTSGLNLPRIGSLAVSLLSNPTDDEGVLQSIARISAIYLPPSLADHLLSLREDVHTKTGIEVSRDHWPGLDIVARAIGAKNTKTTLRLTERKQDEQKGYSLSTFGQPAFWMTTDRGTTFAHDHLGYGEKRLLAFMYHAAANPQILVADELVNGLHHGWIQACLDAIQGQAFLTSQNPLLLDHLPFSSGEQVQRRFILCDRDEAGDWIWQNMDPDAADAFYRAYRVGIQHVSEILETKGLW